MKWLADHERGRAALIDRRKVRAIAGGCVDDLNLSLHGSGMRLAPGRHFLWPWPNLDACRPSVETYADRGSWVRGTVVVNVVDLRDVYIVDIAVVVEMAAVPVAALVAGAAVAIAVVHAAIKTDVRSPIATE